MVCKDERDWDRVLEPFVTAAVLAVGSVIGYFFGRKQEEIVIAGLRGQGGNKKAMSEIPQTLPPVAAAESRDRFLQALVAAEDLEKLGFDLNALRDGQNR